LGLKFSADEVKAVMAATEAKMAGEAGVALPDKALDAVSGGAGTPAMVPTIKITQLAKIGPAASQFKTPFGGGAVQSGAAGVNEFSSTGPVGADWGGCW
jgi:hypothetical protein